MWLERQPVGSLIALALSLAMPACISRATQKSLRLADEATDVRTRIAPLSAGSADPAIARQPVGEDALRGPLDLEMLERSALERRPGLVAAAHRVKALTARAAASGTLPDPEAMLEIWQIPLTRPYALDKAGMIMLSVRQEIPPSGSLDLAAETMAFEARAAAAMVTAEARTLLHEVDRAYADYLEATQLHLAHVQHQQVVEQMASASRARYATGAPLADITKADLESSRMEADLAREHGRIEEARARLNGLLSRPEDAALGPPRVDAPLSIGLPVATVVMRALAKSPEVAAADLMEQAAKSSVRAADAVAKVPAFMVGLNAFMPVNGMPVGYGTTFGMSLPWVWGAAGKRVQGEKHQADAQRASAEETRVRVRSAVSTALAAVRGAERVYLVLRERVRPAATRALDAAGAGYASGGTDLLAWLDAERSSLDVDTALAGARGDLGRALADLDWAAGEHVPRAPLRSAGVEP